MPAPTSSALAPTADATLAAASEAPPAAVEPTAEPLYRVLGGLALRDLTLVESLLELVEQLESREEDPEQLESLFRVDHLATRMRRNSENLLVLAGQDREGQDFEPVPLLDVARAAVSEITDYDRAQVSPLPAVRLLGVAADDVSHILSELLENAISKSPESSPVVIRAERTGDGTLVLNVEDEGIGIPVDRLAEINTRLSRQPVVDVAVTRHMGLYVVGRLAHRHGIRAQLRERPYGGIAASVIIPSQLVRNDPDAAPTEAAGRHQPPGSMAPATPRLSIEARGAEGMHGQRPGALSGRPPYSSARESVGEATTRPGAGDRNPQRRPRPSAGRPFAADQPVNAGRADEDGAQTAPAPAAGYPDAVPAPKFEPADPEKLPKRKPGALSAANGIPAPPPVRRERTPVRQEKEPVTPDEEPTGQSEADRIRNELSGFQLGQRAARHEASGDGAQPDRSQGGPPRLFGKAADSPSSGSGDPPTSSGLVGHPAADSDPTAAGTPDNPEENDGA